MLTRTPDGTSVLDAWTSRRLLPENWSRWQLVTGQELLNANLGPLLLRLNNEHPAAASTTIPLGVAITA